MKSTQYSEKVLDHFRNPRNVGTLEGEDVAIGKVGNPVCGDLMEFYVKIKDERIEDIRFKTFGCGSAIATASMITELAKGKTIEEAMKITRQDVADELEGLPPTKMHCSNLAADALKDAIKKYREKQGSTAKTEKPAPSTKEILGEKEFFGKGVYDRVEDPAVLRDKRVLILDRGERSLELAIELTKQTPRVIFVTPIKDIAVSEDLKSRLTSSKVKILSQSEIVSITGLNTVEKVRIHDLDEDEEYELFVDAVVILQ